MKAGSALVTFVAIAGFATSAFAAEVEPKAVSFEGGSVAAPLTETPGDPAEGRKVFASRKLGNCLACHVNTEMSDQQFHGEVGPPVDGAADRWSVEELRGIVTNAKQTFTDETVMPGFYTLEVGKNVRKDLIGVTILTAQQVEDVVAYLATLKE